MEPSNQTDGVLSSHKSSANIESKPRSWLLGLFWWPHLPRMKRQKNIDGLIPVLTHPRPTMRWTATRILGELWDIPLLVDLGDRDHNRRVQATKSLRDNQHPGIINPLIASLWDPYHWYDRDSGTYFYPVRMGAIEALANIGAPEAIEPILGAIRKGSWNPYRLTLESCLVQMGKPILKPLIALLGDRDPYMRQVAVSTLGELNNPQTIQPLSEFLRWEKDRLLKRLAVQALLRINDEQIISVLAEVAEQDKDQRVQEDLVTFLSRLQDERIIPILAGILQKADSLHRDRMINEIHRFGTSEALTAVRKYGERANL